ncbi:hypothetical protein BKG71_03585 [Mycobacteroides chelonae]|nr:hypothetical protein BKG71_03585 [Mycobacteroides chelonae]
MLSQWQTFRSGPDVENHSERIFLGFDRARAMRMAEEHHAENVRRLAWERYMQENDPPIAHELPRVDRTSQQ